MAIASLLLGPLLKKLIQETKRPSIAIVTDNSRSVGTWLDQSGNQALHTNIGALSSGLGEKYDVTTYSFGEDISLLEADTMSYDQDITNITSSLQYISDVYEGENLGAVILATDGIYNGGQNPLYASLPSNIPVHSIALGDTTKRKDASVQTILHNEVAYLNDEMITQVDIKAINASNQTLLLTIEKETGSGYITVETRNIKAQGNDFFATEEIKLTFKEVGIVHYRYRISSLTNEINRSNNRKDIYIEVLDARQDIGIIAASPHPDITALKQILEQNKNYQVKLYFDNPSSSELSGMDFAILHNLPSGSRNINSLLTSLNNRATPRMFIVGEKTNLTKFNQVQSLITIKGSRGSSNDAQGEVDGSFENFTLSETLKSEIKRYPPLSSPFGEYTSNGSLQTLLHQRIGDITTDFPLLSFADVDGVKSAYLLGTDIWRWKLFDYLQNENFNLITELIDKTIIYTSTKEDKRKFRVNSNSNVYLTNDNVTLTAELYNNSYELVNGPEAVIQLRDAEGNSYDYTFSKNDKIYALELGKISPGSYRYTAETIFNGDQYTAQGKFVVREIQYEMYDLEAQHSLLYALADKTNGSVTYPGQLSTLTDQLLSSDSIKPVIYQNVITKPLMDSKWLFFLLVVPLILEWLLRRYHGSL